MPPFLVVVAGQIVKMPNEDEVAHNVYSNSPAKKFNLGFYALGDSRSVTFETPGVVEVGCSIHQSMHATIFVVPNPHFAEIQEDGSFDLRNVPKGHYKLKIWADGMALEEREIMVLPTGKVEVEVNPVSLKVIGIGKASGAN